MRNIRKKEVIIGTEKAGNSTYRTITDAETGELLDEGWLNKSNKKPGRMPKGSAYFVKLYKTNLVQIVTEKAKEKRLDLDEAGLLFMLFAISGWQTPYIANPDTGKSMNCSEIADFISRDRAHVYDLLERLIKKGMISKVVNGNGRSNYYMINPNVGFYGKTIDDTKHLDVFKTCPYEPKKYIDYRKTPDKKK
jgi:DNA-binding MarR family transcriptional regulator